MGIVMYYCGWDCNTFCIGHVFKWCTRNSYCSVDFMWCGDSDALFPSDFPHLYALFPSLSLSSHFSNSPTSLSVSLPLLFPIFILSPYCRPLLRFPSIPFLFHSQYPHPHLQLCWVSGVRSWVVSCYSDTRTGRGIWRSAGVSPRRQPWRLPRQRLSTQPTSTCRDRMGQGEPVRLLIRTQMINGLYLMCIVSVVAIGSILYLHYFTLSPNVLT